MEMLTLMQIMLLLSVVMISILLGALMRRRNHVAPDKYDHLKESLDSALGELSATSSELVRAEQFNENYSSRIEEQQQTIEKQNGELDAMRGDALTLNRLNSSLSTQLDNSLAKLQELSSEVDLQKEQISKGVAELNKFSTLNASQSEQLTSKNTKIEELLQQITELKGAEEHLEKRLKSQFELISNKIIEDSRNKVNEFNATRMQELVKPLEKDIKDFKEQITTANKEQTKERTELEMQIKQMVQISQGMSQEAKNLSSALRGNNKTAGNWGETILENILQNSGLTQGKEGYELQEMVRDENGNAYVNEAGRKMIPDAIVHFPDNRNVIVDSKVSISAYTDYCNAEDEESKALHLKRHIASIKSHIEGLNVKSYERYVTGSLDFVMMFIPNDFAAMVALQEDLNLWQNAYNKKILIISPTNLITSLKIVSDLWSREKQQQNVEKILDRGRFLYDKCCSFVESFKKIGDGVASIQKLYTTTATQLGAESGVIRQAEMLVELGIKSKKSLAIKSDVSKRIAELQSNESEDITE